MLRIKSSLTGKEYQFPDGFDTQMAGELIKEQERPFTSQDMITQRLNPVASASPTTPTLRDRFGTTVREGLESVGFSRSGARGASEGFQNISDFIPMTAASYAGDSFGREMAEDDYFGAAGSLAEGALEVNPIADALGAVVLGVGKKLKFDPDNPEPQDFSDRMFFHGTSDVIDSPSLRNTQVRDEGLAGRGFYLTQNPALAGTYAETSKPTTLFEGELQGPNIHPFRIKAKNTLVLNPEEMKNTKQFLRNNPSRIEEFTNNLKQRGYDSIGVESGGEVQEINVFDTSMVQSPFSRGLLDEIDTSYRGSHTAPYRDDEGYNPSLDDVSSMYGDDIYTGNALRYFGEGRDYDKKAIDIIQRMRGNPDAEITIYRALPIGQNEINPRDWVTTTREYALEHIGDDEGYHIVSKKVKASDVFTEGNSIHEFGYDPLEK